MMKTEYEKAIDAQEPVAWITEGGDVTRSYALAVERSFNRAPLPLYQAPPAPSGVWMRALRLADECEESARAWAHEIDTRQRAAAELRRLHVQAAQDEALLRQALSALECSDWYMGQLESIVYSHDDSEIHDARAKVQHTIAALRKRLGEGEQQ